jgi:endonuclease I
MIKHTITTLFVSLLVINLYSQIPAGYYDDVQGLTGNELKNGLHNIIDDHIEFSYNDLRDFILKNTDEDPDNSDNVILLYSGRSQAKSTFGGGANDWNREHVWAKSHGDFDNDPPAGTDAHHIRPTDVSVNSTRGNLDFDIGGSPVSEAPGCYVDGDSFEPRDAVKGDVARMIFYMAVRYDGSDGVPDLEVVDAVNTYPNPEHGKLSQLILWNTMDPPDDFEMNRNDVIYYQYQQKKLKINAIA